MTGAYGGRQRLRALAPACALLALAAIGCKKGGQQEPGGSGAVPTVTVVPAERRDVPIVTQYVGTLDGYVNVEIRARVAGFLQGQHYREGSMVKQGQLLFTIDPRQYQAAVNDAKGALAKAQATLNNARITVHRLRPLVEQRAVAQQDLDTALANEQEADAAVQSARALLQQAQLNLSYTRITSSIDGLAGIAQVRVGNLVGEGQPTLLTTVSQVDPIRARFAVTERDYLEQQRRLAAPGQPREDGPRVELVLADGSMYPRPGQLVVTGREVSPTTGTLAVEALFPNPQQLLRPGQYASIRMVSQTLKNAVLVPQRAINALQSISQVAVVAPDGTAHLRQVQLGPKVDSQQVVTQGLDGGEQVVVDGFAKVKDGQKVTVVQAPPAPAQPPPPQVPRQGVGGSGGGTPMPRTDGGQD